MLTLISPLAKRSGAMRVSHKRESPSAVLRVEGTLCHLEVQLDEAIAVEQSTISYYQSKCVQVLSDLPMIREASRLICARSECHK